MIMLRELPENTVNVEVVCLRRKDRKILTDITNAPFIVPSGMGNDLVLIKSLTERCNVVNKQVIYDQNICWVLVDIDSNLVSASVHVDSYRWVNPCDLVKWAYLRLSDSKWL